MLEVNDYKKYETDLKRRLTLPKYFLSRWAHFETNATSLTKTELNKAKVLYQTLNHLTEEERIFLANKYRAKFEKATKQSRNFKSDKAAAKEHGMNIQQYITLRKGIEFKFFHYLQQYVDNKIIF